ncbi:ribosomal protein S6 kinase-like 1 [Synchiropus splendidus]|uniref:ribosomal protein S6 kinase-like 1 n=1 Tax=Synchiropus splendidus TaxID=270530 RepID=UPI00237DEA24|nr:ribosomal protein S6 kinase-like 1 [Synchiropus splendidus]XP_053701631.1 ribosomal protein S6 kinase-like 1 [Synchiropus splendidus]
MAKRDYLVEAAKQIRMALDSEVNEDYEAAFSYYKNGVDLLLNGVQLDPNKERREAVKRKTTQYLKRAEEIFITHLHDNLGKGSSHLGGYSSLRFRPVRHLSSPVEDLEMCKVVGVSDKVLIVQSMVNKETFVVKSLMKSSWESREQPTIIPQGVPYMVKLLRYYVSEDAVYLHLEHVKGGRLFSRLHKLRHEKSKEHPECTTPGQHNNKLKTSHTSPNISNDLQSISRNAALHSPKRIDESPDAEYPNSWDETQQRLESCGTHSYIEETGCLQNTRSAATFYTKLDRLTLVSGSVKAQLSARIHPPAPTLCLHAGESQEAPALPLSCARVSQALGAMSERREKKVKAGMGLLECSSNFEAAWKAAEPAQKGAKTNLYAVTDLNNTFGHTRTSLALNTGSNGLSSSPAILHLPLHCQTQVRGKASWDNTSHHQGSSLSDSSPSEVVDLAQQSKDTKVEGISPISEDRNGIIVLSSTDRAVFSDHELQTPWPPLNSIHSSTTKKFELPNPSGSGAISPKGEGLPQHADSSCLQKTGVSAGQVDDQIIEVDGWCHLPRIPQKPPTPVQAWWGLPEAEVRVWGAQILLALESLHQQGILCRDLSPRNVLLTSNGKVCLTFFGQWSEVQSDVCSKAMEQMYTAPEIGGVSRVTEACDWWSLGALLFELLTGMPLWQLHPAGIHSHTQLIIPDHLSAAAASLLTELLQFDAGYRLGSGGGGVSDIKCHPFFSSISWKALSC